MTKYLQTLIQALASTLAGIGMIPIGIIYLLGYAMGMRFPAGASSVVGMLIAPILGLLIVVSLGIWIF